MLEALIKNAPDACRRKLAAAAAKSAPSPPPCVERGALAAPKDHEADAYRASLLRCCASVFLEGSQGALFARARGRCWRATTAPPAVP